MTQRTNGILQGFVHAPKFAHVLSLLPASTNPEDLGRLLQSSFDATSNVLQTNAMPYVALSLPAGPLSLKTDLHTYTPRSSRL
jgi:hypothetical protein